MLFSVEEQDIIADNGFRGENFSTNVDYKLNKTDVLSNASRSTIGARSTIRATASSRRTVPARRSTTIFAPATTTSKGINFDYTIALKRTFEPRKHELAVELRFNCSHDEDATALWRESVSSAGEPTGTQVELQQDNWTR